MGAETIVAILIVIVVFAGLLFLRVPVGVALIGASLLGIIVFRDVDAGLTALGAAPFNSASSPSLIVVPLFILMGLLAVKAGLADDAFSSAQRILKNLPGGPAVSSLAGSGVFAAVTGSSMATVATLARVSTDAVRRAGYPTRLAAGAVAAGGTLGVLIPPSIVLVLYGVIAEESIGTLLIAGVVPGLLSIAMYAMAAVLYGSWLTRKQSVDVHVSGASPPPPLRSKVKQDIAGLSVSSVPEQIKWGSLLQLFALFFAAIGTIYLGIATPTEAASFGALGASLILFGHKFRRPKHFLKEYGSSLTETAGTTAMIFLLLVGAGLFNYFLALTGSTTAITDTFADSALPGLVVLILALLILIPLGMFLDGISIILIATPVLHPLLSSFGYDGIWIAILVVKVAEMALITPPVGLNAFVYQGVVKDVSLSEVFRGIIPFLIADIITITLLIVFPFIITWLPKTAGLM